MCGQSAAAGTMGKGGDQGRLPGGGECGDEMDRGEARGEWLRAKGRKNGVGLRRQGGECRGRGGGRTSKVSIQPPDGESWRGWGRGSLPATMAILGPESNQICSSPQSPQQLRRTAVPPRALSAGTSTHFLPPADLSGRPGCGLQGKEEENVKGFWLESQTWATPCAFPRPAQCYLGAETGLCASLLDAPDDGKGITPESSFLYLHPPWSLYQASS